MRMISYLWALCLLVLPLVGAFPLVGRQEDLASELIQNIVAINSSLVALNETLNTFTTYDPLGLVEALKVELQTSQTSNDLVAAARTANESSAFTSEDSGNIAGNITSLEPTIISVLNNIVEHKPAFATAVLFIGDISQTVESNLEQQRELSREFADAVTAKLAEPYAGLAPLIAGQIDNGKCKTTLGSGLY